jgi:hypothetical protein
MVVTLYYVKGKNLLVLSVHYIIEPHNIRMLQFFKSVREQRKWCIPLICIWYIYVYGRYVQCNLIQKSAVTACIAQ